LVSGTNLVKAASAHVAGGATVHAHQLLIGFDAIRSHGSSSPRALDGID